jgi:hypothetical protein
MHRNEPFAHNSLDSLDKQFISSVARAIKKSHTRYNPECGIDYSSPLIISSATLQSKAAYQLDTGKKIFFLQR